MVFIHHYNPFPENIFGTYVHDFFNEFHVGVTFFFVLSGFLIAYRYYDIKINIKNYIINRFARIYPIYFLLTTLTFLAYIYLNHQQHLGKDILLYILNITFVKGLFAQLKFTGIAQGWSLTVEEMFYLSAPIIFYFLRKNKLYFLLPILLMLIGFLLTGFFSTHDFYSFMGNNEFMLNYTFFGRCTEFFIGIGLSMVVRNNLIQTKYFSLTYFGATLIIIFIFLISLLEGSFDLGIRHPLGKFINTFLLPLFGISIFYLGLIKEKTVLSRFFSSKIMVLLGKSSYIFYLIHQGLFAGLIKLFTHNTLIIFILVNILSIVLYHYLENPINTYIRNKFKSPVIIPQVIKA